MKASTKPVREGIHLPKISVPTFDGHILQWQLFWEQFELYIHNRAELSDAVKLAYLRDVLKDGPAPNVKEGLAQMDDNYSEAVSCLQHCYDRPRLIHQAHICAILNIPSLIKGNGKEFSQFRNRTNQHLQALKIMRHDSFESLVTANLEAKMDQTTMQEWQRYSRGHKDILPFSLVLEFMDLQARDTYNTIHVVQSSWPGF